MSKPIISSRSEMKDPIIKRTPVGIWGNPGGARWTNEGMTRLLGFLIEGIAKSEVYVFRIVLPNAIRDAALSDLAALNARAGLDYSVHSPADVGQTADDPASLVQFANDHLDVVGWLSLFPTLTFARLLNAPVTTIFPDAVPIVFPEFSDLAWAENGNHKAWRDNVAATLKSVDQVITFSNHVADTQAVRLFGVPRDAIQVVPHASPDLQQHLPFVLDRGKTLESIVRAANIVRAYANETYDGYLRDFPFEDVQYIAVSTQDRVTKNLRIVADAMRVLIREKRLSVKVFTTAPLHFGANWTPLPGYIEASQTQFDFVSIPDVPRDVHAAFYHCAAVAVHPSIFEGGQAPFPFYEAVSVGTPCLVARGPHVAEFVESHPDMAPFTFDPNDASGLAALIEAVIDDPSEAIKRQQTIYARLATRGWDAVAGEYAKTATAHRTTV